MATQRTYVRTDDHGAMRVGETRISLDSVVIAFQQGEAPESIQRNFPSLTLEEVYGAIAYYLANKDEVHGYLERQQQLWERLVAEQERNPSPAMQRVRTTMQRLHEVSQLRPDEYGAALDQLKSELAARVAAGESTAEQADSLVRLQEWMRLTRGSRPTPAVGPPQPAVVRQ